jgi:hypothetical protein
MSVEMKKEPVKQIAAILGILSIVLAVMVILTATNVIPTLNSNRSARLVNVAMGGYDIPNQHVLHIHGYVCNVGLDTAYHVQVHVVGVYTTGGEAMDTYVNVGSGVVYGGDNSEVTADVAYSANGLGSWTITPVWSYTP